DPETNEWKEGFDSQREKWELDYAAAQARWEAHKVQVAAAANEPIGDVPASSGSSFSADESGAGTLADDEALAALREKLSGNS
ncbi:MAG: 30S ribosomal protein S1, partial [Terrimesophilobacter sp.]